MKFDKNTPRAAVTICDSNLTAPEPYKAGHALTENEASVMNQIVRENLRNNMASAIKKMKAEGKSDTDLQAALDAYAATYEFGVRKSAAPKITDPVEKEAWKLARGAVVAALKKKGVVIGETKASDIDELVEKALASKHGAAFREQAKAIVAAAASIGNVTLDLSDAAPAKKEAKAKKQANG